MPGKNNGASVLNATRILLDPICGDSAQYCVEQKPCVEDGYICDSNYARDTAAWLSRECGIKRSQSKLSNKMLLRNNERFSKQKNLFKKLKNFTVKYK